MASWAPIPLWQNQELQKLSAEGNLSGVDPMIMSAIVQAESGGGGGAVNSSGYGGFFGIGLKQGGSSLYSTTPAAFDTQAQIAASDFASLLNAHGGDPIAAEIAYQGGNTEGASVMEQLGLAAAQPEASPMPLASPSQIGGINGYLTGNSSGGQKTHIAQLGPFSLDTPYGLISRALLVVFGVFLLYLGMKQLTGNSNGAIDTVVIGSKQATQTMRRHAKTAAKVGAAGAE